MIANILRTETAQNHAALESLMFVNEIMNHTLSIENYKKLLTINYIIHQKLETELTNKLSEKLSDELEMESRIKLSALEKDLKYWDIDYSSLPALNFELYIPENNDAEVLGSLYVLEGATLGGNMIKKHILANPNFEGKEAGLNYYGIYGDTLGTKWKSFVTILNENVTEADYQRCIKSANETFANLIKLSEQLS